MVQVEILGFRGALGTAITGVLDLLSLAGVTWERLHGEAPQPCFQVRLVSLGGEPVSCINGVTLASQGDFDPDWSPPLVLVPTIGAPIERVLQTQSHLLDWLRWRFRQGAHLASNCSGAFSAGGSRLA